MPKRLNYPHRRDGIISQDNIGMLKDPNRLKEYVATVAPKKRQKIVAFLHAVYTAPELEAMLGVKRGYVRWCSHLHPDIVESAQLCRNFAIADLSERRVIELLQKINIDNIPDEKKAKSIRDLMESADLARGQTNPATEQKEENTMELVFRLTKRMAAKKEKEPIDITEEVKELNNE